MTLKSLGISWLLNTYGIAVSKYNVGLLKAINKALGEMKEDGTYDRIIQQMVWCGMNAHCEFIAVCKIFKTNKVHNENFY